MSELGNQLNSQTLAEVLAATFNTVGGRVFPDERSQAGLADFIAIVTAWQQTHAQTFGNVLPNTGASNAGDFGSASAFELVAAEDNEVIRINGISIDNAGGDPAVVSILIGGNTVLARVDVPPSAAGGTVASTQIISSPIVISKGQNLTASLVSGTGSDITVNVSTVKCCQ